MARLYPELEPYASGTLDTGDGNRLSWETSGNPDGRPALVLHGGPGSGSTPGARRYFDPAAYRIIQFDQRNCGRSTPHASEPSTSLAANTTAHLLADIERLREHLGVQRWLVWGGSWGSTLALAYAERHPECVTAIVLAGVATTTADEVEWVTRGAGRLFPEAFDRFLAGLPEADRSGNLAAAYSRLLESPDPAVRENAARDWCDWEMAIVAVHPDHRPHPRYEDPRFRLCFARIVTHYFKNAGFLEDGILLREAHRLHGIPCVMVHGRLDLASPLRSAWELQKAWPKSDLVLIGGAGHDQRDPGLAEAVVAATDRFRRL